jgi:hypothetical protein
MAVMKRELSDTPDGKGQLVYDTENRTLYVESTKGHVTDKFGLDDALTQSGDSADQLRRAIIDLFRA